MARLMMACLETIEMMWNKKWKWSVKTRTCSILKTYCHAILKPQASMMVPEPFRRFRKKVRHLWWFKIPNDEKTSGGECIRSWKASQTISFTTWSRLLMKKFHKYTKKVSAFRSQKIWQTVSAQLITSHKMAKLTTWQIRIKRRLKISHHITNVYGHWEIMNAN